jgi:Na+/H+ antiporter NhaD/arsenite permease-like protein
MGDAWLGPVMLALLLATFTAMTAFRVPLALAMSLLACAFLLLQGAEAAGILATAFEHYAPITILFTAVAVPAHMIERSNGFKWLASWAGYRFGKLRLRAPRLTTPLMITTILLATYVTAGLMHNVTSILIMTPIVIRLCTSYGVPSRWVLSGALVASNLGGFSTRWGDTPNIKEAEYWGLTASDFWKEIVPPNLIVMGILTFVVVVLTRRSLARSRAPAPSAPTLEIARAAVDWKAAREDLVIDRRLLSIGVVALLLFIVLHVLFDDWKIAIGAATVLGAVLLERKSDRLHTLTSLGGEVYLAFAAIFVIAESVSHSPIGEFLHAQIEQTKTASGHVSPMAVTLTGYLGTMFTEAASWVTAVGAKIQEMDPSHTAAWALGAGICAGSSSLVTAASAGIVLVEESGRFKDPEHAITFRSYLPFGIGFSLVMLAFYVAWFTFVA